MDIRTGTWMDRRFGLKFIGAVKNPCCGYDEIVNRIGGTVNLPGELIIEILYRLPVKSLARFKSVCMSWKLLINSHGFIHKHVHRPNPQLGGFSLDIQGDLFPYEISYVVGACNGIICLRTACPSNDNLAPQFLLFNPSTKEFSYVPCKLRGQGYYHHRGFVYLPKTQEYQILSFHVHGGNKLVDLTTLILGKTRPMRVAKKIRMPGRIIDTRKVTCGTTIYWLGMNLDGNNEIIICYDVIEGRFSKMNMPPSGIAKRSPQNHSLSVIKGSVIMFVNPNDEFTFFDIWMLIDDVSNGKSWMKYREIGPLETVVYPLDVCWNDSWILCSSKGFKEEYVRGDLFYYDLETNQVEKYYNFHPVWYDKIWVKSWGWFVNYVETLVTINSLDENAIAGNTISVRVRKPNPKFAH